MQTTNIEINTTYVKVPNGDLQIDAYLAQPDSTGIFGAVIVFQEIFGVNSNIRDITELIAQQGYVAVAPAMYQRIAPRFEFGFSEKHIPYSPEAYELGWDEPFLAKHPNFNFEAAIDAWQQVLELFQNNLKE